MVWEENLNNVPHLHIKVVKQNMTAVKTYTSVLLVISWSLHTMQDNNVQTPRKSSHTLLCYQCSSSNRDFHPLCDTSYFKLGTEKEQLNLLMQCPRNRKDFCFKKIVIGQNYVHTSRGCSSLYDDVGNRLYSGCTTMQTNVTITICICDRSGVMVAKN